MNSILWALGALTTGQLSPSDEHNAVMYTQQLIMKEMVAVCAEKFPSDRTRFETTLDLWSRVNRDAIRNGKAVALMLGQQEGIDDAEQAYKQEATLMAEELAAASAEQVRAYCDNLIQVLQAES